MALPISQVAYHHTEDIDPKAQIDGNKLTDLAHLCIVKATTALESGVGDYNELHRHSMITLFESLRATHLNLRRLLGGGVDDPGTVDALTLARVQLEILYMMCLMFQDSAYVTAYLQEGWSKQYSQFLLKKEECGSLPRFDKYVNLTPKFFEVMRDFLGITVEQQITIDHYELGVSLPPNTPEMPIPSFPTPGKAVRKITDPDRKKMLERLYPEYLRLCSFIHGLAEANFFKALLKIGKSHDLFTPSKIKDTFDKEVAEPAFLMSVLSMIQSAAELTTLYPADVELRAAVIPTTEPLQFQILDFQVGNGIARPAS
jgi:hypothetical protein